MNLLDKVGLHCLKFGASGKAVVKFAATLPMAERAPYLVQALAHFKTWVSLEIQWKAPPVDIRCFIESEDFLNQRDVIYRKNMDELFHMNNGQYVEAVLTGAIGTGKSTLAQFSQAFQLYILSCIHNPQRLFRLAQSSEILIVFQSLTAQVAKTVEYNRFKAMIDSSPYFQHVFPYDKGIESELKFPGRIIIRALSGSSLAAIGQNVIGGILDEVNFMAKTETSKQAADGGIFDQAMEMYNSIVRRRKSRFLIKGRLFGLLCLVSSKRYPGEFTDLKALEARDQKSRHGKTDIFVYDKRLWEVKPDDTYCGEWFKVFCGDASNKPRILDDDEVSSEAQAPLTIDVPIEFRSEFERDILSAIRDIAGMATLALHPFILDTDAVGKAFGRRPSILTREDCDFVQTTVSIRTTKFTSPKAPRFAHIDLALTGDSAGLAIGHISKFVEMERGGWSETLPEIAYDCILEVKPPKQGEINFAMIRRLLYRIRELGLNLKWVSFDSFQSRDSIQVLAGQGFVTGTQSMDTDTLAYDLFKSALYDRRIAAPTCARAQREITRLERNPKTGRVDHPADSSKDLSDAMAGVAFGLTMRRQLWSLHGIPVTKIPSHLLKGQANKDKSDEKSAGMTTQLQSLSV